jgi:radical SAM-linked protein
MRLRVTYATDESVKYVGHLDFARAWERGVRRAQLPLSYSQGFNPQPRIQFAAALPVGFTSTCEVVDLLLEGDWSADDIVARLQSALPQGIHLLSAQTIPENARSLQSRVRGATYAVEVETAEPAAAFRARLEAFLAKPSAWRERRRGQKAAQYDLRPLVETLRYRGACELGQAFEADMRAEPGATGRPDELLAELGFGSVALRIERIRQAFEDE